MNLKKKPRILTMTSPRFDIYLYTDYSEIQKYNINLDGNFTEILSKIYLSNLKERLIIYSNNVLNTSFFLNKSCYRKIVIDCLVLNKLDPILQNIYSMTNLSSRFFKSNYMNLIETSICSTFPSRLNIVLSQAQKFTYDLLTTNEKLFLMKKQSLKKDVTDNLNNYLSSMHFDTILVDLYEFSENPIDLLNYLNIIRTVSKECKIVVVCLEYLKINYKDLIVEIINLCDIIIFEVEFASELGLFNKKTVLNTNFIQGYNSRSKKTQTYIFLDEINSLTNIIIENGKIKFKHVYQFQLGIKLEQISTIETHFLFLKSSFIGGYLSKFLINEPSDVCFNTGNYTMKRLIDILFKKEIINLAKSNYFIQEKDVSNVNKRDKTVNFPQLLEQNNNNNSRNLQSDQNLSSFLKKLNSNTLKENFSQSLDILNENLNFTLPNINVSSIKSKIFQKSIEKSLYKCKVSLGYQKKKYGHPFTKNLFQNQTITESTIETFESDEGNSLETFYKKACLNQNTTKKDTFILPAISDNSINQKENDQYFSDSNLNSSSKGGIYIPINTIEYLKEEKISEEIELNKELLRHKELLSRSQN